MVRNAWRLDAPSTNAASLRSAGIDGQGTRTDQEEVREAGPQIDHQDGEPGQPGILQPGDVGPEDLVDQPEVGVQHGLPHQSGEDERQAVRDDQQQPVDLLAAHPALVHHQRQDQPEAEVQDRGQDREREGPQQDRDEAFAHRWVGEQLGVVLESDADLPTRIELLALGATKLPIVVVGRIDLAGDGVDHGVLCRVVREAGLRLAGLGDRLGPQVDALVLVDRWLQGVPLGLVVGVAGASVPRFRLWYPVTPVTFSPLRWIRRRPPGSGPRWWRWTPAPVCGSVTSMETTPSLTIGTTAYCGPPSTATTFCAWIATMDASLSPEMARPVVGERGIGGEVHRVQLEHEQEHQPRQQVLQRQVAANEVGVVDREEDDPEEHDGQPPLVGDCLHHRPDQQGIGESDEDDLDERAGGPRGAGGFRLPLLGPPWRVRS